jgi:hypothetical protein
MPAQMGLDGNAPHDARPLNPDGIASLNKAVLSHCEFNARFRSVMAAASAWFGGPDVADSWSVFVLLICSSGSKSISRRFLRRRGRPL